MDDVYDIVVWRWDMVPVSCMDFSYPPRLKYPEYVHSTFVQRFHRFEYYIFSKSIFAETYVR